MNIRQFDMCEKLSQVSGSSKRQFVNCMAAVMVWGMIAHGYIFLNALFSHDSLNEFNADEFGNEWKIQLGRVLVPLYRAVVRGDITMPWLIGIISLVYIGIAVFIVVKIFDIRSRLGIILAAGIFTVNITVISQAATYINDMDCNMLALLMAVLSVYMWRNYKRGFLYGMVPVGIAIGLYQSYISVAVTLIIMVCIIDLLEYKKFHTVFNNGIKGIAMLIGGGVIYFILVKVVLSFTGISLITGKYNSLSNVFEQSVIDMLKLVKDEYIYTLLEFITVPSMYSAAMYIQGIAACLTIIFIIRRISSKKIGIKEKVISIILILLLPLGMNISYILVGGMSHDLMIFAVWLVYLFAYLIADKIGTLSIKGNTGNRISAIIIGIMIFVVLWGNVQLANEAYLKKNIEHESNNMLFTRVIYDLEKNSDSNEQVIFVGTPNNEFLYKPGFENVSTLTGMGSNYVLVASNYERCLAYFNYIAAYPINLAPEEKWEEYMKRQEVKEMPVYPEDGSIREIDGIVVVKLGNTEE
ncbi:MAG: glucosyltransferase domain-containing protein [Bacillota bacterium]|nr:glucosyltransferase domain-containing protein [Bacillota bacterium]